MARFRKNESIAAKRRVSIYVTEDDGVTPADPGTDWSAQKATCNPAGTTHLTSAILQYSIAGAFYTSQLRTIKFVGDGSGTGSVATSANDWTFHFAPGTTTVGNARTALAAAHDSDTGTIAFTGTWTDADVLASGDAFGPLPFVGGFDIALRIRQGTSSYGFTAGTLTNTTDGPTFAPDSNVPGEWIYEFTQSELNFVGSEVGLRLFRPSVQALALFAGTHFAQILAANPGSGGNVYTFQTAAGGSGTGALTKSGNAYTFTYASGTTTMGNMAAALAADGVLTLLPNSDSDVLTSTGDTLGPIPFTGGFDGFAKSIISCEMNDAADFDSIGEGSATYGDMQRAIISAVLQKVGDFRTGTYAFKSQDGSKTRWTVQVDASGRITSTPGDLTP